MSKFSELIKFCAQQFNNLPPCAVCEMDRCRSCHTETCYPCLKHIHSFSNKTLHYSCEKITYNYVLKHGYRYASEMGWAFIDIKELFETTQPLSIFSIGCGPSTELYGASIIYRTNPISYFGFDLSDKWKSIQEFNIKNLSSSKLEINYLETEFITYIEETNSYCDILVMNYLLSDFIKFQSEECMKFLDGLIYLIMKGHFKVIIINDVMLMYSQGTGFYCMEYIEKNIKDNSSYSFTFEKRHFTIPNEFQKKYGIRHSNEILTKRMVDEVSPFDPFRTCGSIQLIIKTQKK